MLQACGSSYEVSDEEVDEGEVDKLVQSVLRQAVEVQSGTAHHDQRLLLVSLSRPSLPLGTGALFSMLLWPRRSVQLQAITCGCQQQHCVACAPQKGIDDHFAARGKGGGKAFRGHFLEAWDHLVREAAAAEVLFDGFVLSKLLDLVMAMAKCAPALAVLSLLLQRAARQMEDSSWFRMLCS